MTALGRLKQSNAVMSFLGHMPAQAQPLDLDGPIRTQVSISHAVHKLLEYSSDLHCSH